MRLATPAFCFAAAQNEEDTSRKLVPPSTTIFVVNFDVRRVNERDIERHFEGYGRIMRCQIKRNYAFVQAREVCVLCRLRSTLVKRTIRLHTLVVLGLNCLYCLQ
jgi:RNA recognition motif-containing protein